MSAMPPAPGKGPIFIMGSMGTGSTLLRLVLDSHDAIAIPPETGFMRAYNAHRFVPFKWTGRNWAKRMGWSNEELDEELRAFYDRIFMRYVETHGKQRWGEKTPLHTWHWGSMARVFPDAVFVIIMRHPGGSMASNMNRWKFTLDRATAHFERYTREQMRRAAMFPDRTVMVRYEELLLQPEPVLRALLEWLGEPWSDKVLEHHVVQSGRGGKEIVEGKSRVSDPLDVARIDKWQKTIDEAGRKKTAKRLGRLPELLGYDLHDAALLNPVNPDGRPITHGSELKARIEGEFADLELKAKGSVPWFERLYHPRDFRLTRADAPPTAARAAKAEAAHKPAPDTRSFARRAADPWVQALPPGARKGLVRLRRRLK